MTISSTYTPTIVTGDGTNNGIGTVFKYFADSDVIVTQRVTATGAETTMVDATHYNITGGSSTGATGTVTPIDGATDFASTMTWTIQRSIPLTQSTDLVDNDILPAASLEASLDRLTMLVQDLEAKVNRCLKVPISDALATDTDLPSSVDRISTSCTFDSSGDVSVT